MSGDLYLGAYWRLRKESVDECADRLMSCLADLEAVSPLFATWYEKGLSQKDALQQHLDFHSRESVLRLLEKGRHRRDLDKSVIEDLGFSAGLWNGQADQRAVGFSCCCGLYSNAPGLGGNSFVLDFPEILGDLEEKNRVLQSLVAVARAWDPEWAGIISRASRSTRHFTPGSPFVDWMIYLNRLEIDPSQLPSSASVVKADSLGSIIITQDVPVDANDQSHVQNVRAVEAAIL